MALMPAAVTISVLVVATILNVAFSWRSLPHPGFHGFFRFFAFEAILCIIVVNAPRWFDRPFAPLQLFSWVLLTVSFFLAVHAYHLLRHLGRPSAPASGSPLFALENTTSLVTTGAYRFIRHPAYASLLYLAWGAALKSLSLLTAILAIVASAALIATAKAEEAENIQRFGSAYRDYMARTRLFIPFVL
ncbi:MAG: methyltransferase family protein [Thermoanaerobaculales bacterium]